MELFPFQVAASTQIATRFQQYSAEPLTITLKKLVPFYQNLSAITGSGKTVILADALQQIRTHLPVEPIVLWLSKGKVVVWQTYTNLSTGKYADSLGGYNIKPLLDCTPEDVANVSQGLLLVATVGKFNQRDREEGDRKIFRVALDVAEQSLWDLLKARKSGKNRRPLIVVYDEGHNLSDQQTELLLDLAPDALIAASATMRIPEALSYIINRLRHDKGWKDEDLVTTVRSSEVVASGLVKKNILLGGYVTPMETAVDEMLQEMRGAETSSKALGLSFRPKAIYVSTTNTVDGVAIREDMERPFTERKARPILIWRYLVERLGVDPGEIAVYCDLKFTPRYPHPTDFNLFAGGDSDYNLFISGNYRHIIFNLTLQEGWDDPTCCFAYVDKEMGSPAQVTQLVGRVLRQPGAQHYPSPNLNTAHFYIRTDEKGVFEKILSDVSRKLAVDFPDVILTVRKNTSGGSKPYKEPRQDREIPTISIDSTDARIPLSRIIDSIFDHSGDKKNTIGKGSRIQILQEVGSEEQPQQEWVEVEHSNPVTARWILRREVQRLFSSRGNSQRNPLNLCDIEQPKFDALVEYNSPAAAGIREAAGKIVSAYIQHSVVVQNAQDNPYKIDKVAVDESKLEKFKHSIHEGYSDLNEFELEFARALDKTKLVWCRNPSQSGFGIPLLDDGDTQTFYPDFLVWLDQHIIAIDPKAKHLIAQDSYRKLLSIDKIEEGPELLIRLVSKGEWCVNGGQPKGIDLSKDCYTVWSLKQSKLHATVGSLEDTVENCLRV